MMNLKNVIVAVVVIAAIMIGAKVTFFSKDQAGSERNYSMPPESPEKTSIQLDENNTKQPVDDGSSQTNSEAIVDSIYPAALMGQHAQENLLQVYEVNLGEAEKGDADSMVKVAEVIRNCVDIGSTGSWEAFTASAFYQSGQFPREMEDLYRDLFDEIGDDCSQINADKPAQHLTYMSWSNSWYERAAARGNDVAKAELSLQRPELTTDEFLEVAEALSEETTSGDHRTFYLVSRLYNYREHSSDLGGNTGAMWRYVGCLNHRICNPSAMLIELGAQYRPEEVSQIREVAEGFNKHRPDIDIGQMLTITELSEVLSTYSD